MTIGFRYWSGSFLNWFEKTQRIWIQREILYPWIVTRRGLSIILKKLNGDESVDTSKPSVFEAVMTIGFPNWSGSFLNWFEKTQRIWIQREILYPWCATRRVLSLILKTLNGVEVVVLVETA